MSRNSSFRISFCARFCITGSCRVQYVCKYPKETISVKITIPFVMSCSVTQWTPSPFSSESEYIFEFYPRSAHIVLIVSIEWLARFRLGESSSYRHSRTSGLVLIHILSSIAVALEAPLFDHLWVSWFLFFNLFWSFESDCCWPMDYYHSLRLYRDHFSAPALNTRILQYVFWLTSDARSCYVSTVSLHLSLVPFSKNVALLHFPQPSRSISAVRIVRYLPILFNVLVSYSKCNLLILVWYNA